MATLPSFDTPLDLDTAAKFADDLRVLGSTPEQIVSGHKGAISPAQAIKSILNNGNQSATITLSGDSTGNAPDEWFIRGLNQWMPSYPNYSTVVANWNDATLSYDDPITYQQGAAGEAYIELSRATNDSVSVLYSGTTEDNLGVSGDLDIAVKFSCADFSSVTGEGCLMGRFEVGGNRSWVLALGANKRPLLWWSENGTDLIQRTLPNAIAIEDNEVYYLRCTLDLDNDNGGYDLKFFNSTDDGITWTQLQDTIVGDAPTSLFPSTLRLLFNGRGSAQLDMNLYRAYVKDGIDGKTITSPNAAFYKQRVVPTSVDCQGNIFSASLGASDRIGAPALVVMNASTSGKKLEYGVLHQAAQLARKPDLMLISYSHNEAPQVDYAAYSTYIDNINTISPLTPVVPVTQNPKASPSTEDAIYLHAYRNAQIVKIAAMRSLYCIDAFSAFENYVDTASLINADGTHLTEPAGNQFWSDLFIEFLNS